MRRIPTINGPLLHGTHLLFWIYSLHRWFQKSSGGPGSGGPLGFYERKSLRAQFAFAGGVRRGAAAEEGSSLVMATCGAYLPIACGALS